MQLSRFVLVYPHVTDDEHVLYNVLADRLIAVNGAILEAVERWRSGEAPCEGDEAQTADYLLEAGFLAESREADEAALRAHLLRVAEGNPGIMYITLMPTLACDLACDYCFQKESPAFHRMSAETEPAAVRWILDRVEAGGLRKLVVHYCGGEALTRKDYLLRTAAAFGAAMRRRGGEFAWEITTNGVQLDLPFVKAMQAHGEGSIKITLDGDRETHDRARTYRDGRGTFDRIFANLAAVAGHVRLRLGGNFLPGQEGSYVRLLDRLQEAGLLAQFEAVRFKPIVEATREQAASCTGCAASGASEKSAETLVQIGRAIEERKPLTPQARAMALQRNPCELHWTHAYTIDPDGRVYKCPAVAGRAEMAINDVLSEGADKPAPLTAARPWEEHCGDCAFQPVCVGGCLGGQNLRTGRVDQVHCRKPEYEATYAEKAMRRHREEFSGSQWQTAGAAAAAIG